MTKKKETYVEMLKDPRWQKKRLEIMQRDNFTCQHCGAQDKSLQVHHLWYSPLKKPWEYDNSAFITLCEHCHENETECNSSLYSTFSDLKTIFGQQGLSKQLLDAIFYRIALFLINKYDRNDACNDSIKELLYDAACGVQLYSDAKSLEKIGIDMSEYFKYIKNKNLCKK